MPKISHKKEKSRLTHLFEKAYLEFHTNFHRTKDPIHLVDLYEDPRDKEVIAFLVSCIAYGNVASIVKDCKTLFEFLGPRPYETIYNKKFIGKLDTFYHRFTVGIDVEILLLKLSEKLQKSKSIENVFLENYSTSKASKENISAFVTTIQSVEIPQKYQKFLPLRKKYIQYLLPNPEQGSTCKRLNLFLRWVVRPKDEIDLGLWKQVPPAQLMLPVDTHVMKALKSLEWIKTQNPNWNVVEAATEKLRELDPLDPIRFDFALCHLSMVGNDILNYEKELE